MHSAAHAQAFAVNYNFSNTAANGFASDAVVASLGASPLTNGAGLLESGFGGARTSNPGLWHATTAASWTPGTDYFEFTLTPAAGYSMALTSFSANLIEGLEGTIDFYLTSSVSGFSAILGSTTSASDGTATLSFSGFNQNFSALTGATTLRIYGYTRKTPVEMPGDPFIFQATIDQIQVGGSLAVSAIPEPATYAAIFGGAVLLGAVWLRRRGRLLEN